MSLTCTAASLEAHEPLAGTAPVATCYLIIEQPGPWGREALLDSRFPRELGLQLLELTNGTQVKIVLARHPDRLERDQAEGRNVWIAHTAPGHRGMRHGLLDSLEQLVDWDFAAIAQGSLPPIGHIQRRPLTFVCTHGSRDACCAMIGRPVYEAVLASVPAEDRSLVWEVSHLGGHRFAPTILSLPGALVHGRLSAQEAIAMREEASQGRVQLHGFRGRSGYPAPLQVAGIAVREVAGIVETDGVDVLRVVNGRAMPAPLNIVFIDDRMETEVRHDDGRTWRVTVQRTQLPGARGESCGKSPEPIFTWAVTDLEQVGDWR